MTFVPGRSPDPEWHPAANLFPMLPEPELRALAEDIRANGQRHPIVVFAGKILDGRNRWRACQLAEVEPRLEYLERCDSPTDYVLSLNLHRRHLDTMQRAVVATEAKRLYAEEAKQRQRVHGGTAPGRQRTLDPESGSSDGREPTSIVRAAHAVGAGKDAAATMDKISRDAPEVFEAAKRGTVKKVQDAKRLAALPAEDRARALAALESGEAKTVRMAAALPVAERLNTAPTPPPEGPFRVIVLDPPWRYGKRAADATRRGMCPYPDMDVREVCLLPVPTLAHEDCVLWLWTTNAFMREAYECLAAWGFEGKTILTWVKERMGTGDWLRGQTEHCLLAVRGRPTVTLTNQTTALLAPAREHSRKPDEFYRLVESLCPGSKLEMFAREGRDGWTSWGAETGKFHAA
jgi:N6-adenosine-specific RNA methylase IME4/ParB-like chromosome segregation protein Spo0J